MKSTAKAKQAAMLAHQHEMLRKRAETAQRQRKDAAAAKKAARERETVAKARKNSCVDTVCTALCSLGNPSHMSLSVERADLQACCVVL